MTVGPGADQARRDHLGHIRRVTEGRPCVTLKLAETADGFASGGPHDQRLQDHRADRQRAASRCCARPHEAIMVGVGTALADDPALTVRLPGARPQAVAGRARHRICAWPLRSRLATDGARPADAGHRRARTRRPRRAQRLADLRRRGRARRPRRGGPCRSRRGAGALSARGVTRVFSEGGPRVAARLIALGLADEVVIFTAEKPLGRAGLPALSKAARAALADPSRYRLVETAAYGPDAMRVWERRDDGFDRG